MLYHLYISHYALIDTLDIDWQAGFTAITGETGAGKSIILGAIGLLMGQRADAKAIRTGEKKCVVEAAFKPTHPALPAFCEANDIDFDTDEIILRREVMISGKSRAFINDCPVKLTDLKEVSQMLLDVHSQHQNLLLRDERFLLDTLDGYLQAAPDAANVVGQYHDLYKEWQQTYKKLQALRRSLMDNDKNSDYLSYQLEQVESLNLQPAEQQELEQEQELLSHSEEIKEHLYQAAGLLDQGESGGVTRQLRGAADALRRIASHYQQADSWADRLTSVRIELDDLYQEIVRGTDQVDYDPQRLAFIEDRLGRIYDLEQKHHVTTSDELLALRDEWQAALTQSSDMAETLARLENQEALSKQQLTECAARLTAKRHEAAAALTLELTSLLRELGMPHVQLAFHFEPASEGLRPTGADALTLLFSANKNIPLRDVSTIASGGEIARLMLALKSIACRRGHFPTIIFDEIDTGVSGMMAESMARVMLQMSTDCQVICITHLPQIAALGLHHYKVYKEEDETATHSHLVPLSSDERVEEIAHLLSGVDVTEAALANARHLLGYT